MAQFKVETSNSTIKEITLFDSSAGVTVTITDGNWNKCEPLMLSVIQDAGLNLYNLLGKNICILSIETADYQPEDEYYSDKLFVRIIDGEPVMSTDEVRRTLLDHTVYHADHISQIEGDCDHLYPAPKKAVNDELPPPPAEVYVVF